MFGKNVCGEAGAGDVGSLTEQSSRLFDLAEDPDEVVVIEPGFAASRPGSEHGGRQRAVSMAGASIQCAEKPDLARHGRQRPLIINSALLNALGDRPSVQKR
jgi:hypothetical protein